MITVPFLFVSEDSLLDGQLLSVSNMFDVYPYEPLEIFVQKFYVSIGLLGDESDGNETVFLKFSGTSVESMQINIPIIFRFFKKNQLNYTGISFNSFPIFKEETVFIEIHHANKILNRFPVSFLKKTMEEGEDDAGSGKS